MPKLDPDTKPWAATKLQIASVHAHESENRPARAAKNYLAALALPRAVITPPARRTPAPDGSRAQNVRGTTTRNPRSQPY